MKPRKIEPPPVINRLHSGAFAEKILSKYSPARRDIWGRLSLVFRDEAALAQGEQDSLRQFFINISLIARQKEENLSFYKRININHISTLINRYLRSAYHSNSYPAGNNELLASVKRRRENAGGGRHVTGLSGKTGTGRATGYPPGYPAGEIVPEVMLSGIERRINLPGPVKADYVNRIGNKEYRRYFVFPYWLNYTVPGATSRYMVLRRTQTGKIAQAGKEFIAAGDTIINFLPFNGFRSALSASPYRHLSLTETDSRTGYPVQADIMYNLQQPLSYQADPAAGLRPQGYPYMLVGSGKDIYNAGNQFLNLKGSQYWGHHSLSMRILQQAVKTDSYFRHLYLNWLPVRDGILPAAYSHPGLFPGMDFVFEGRPGESYGPAINYRQARSMPAAPDFVFSAILERVLAMPVERLIRAQRAVTAGSRVREKVLHVPAGRPGGLSAAHISPGRVAGMNLAYDGDFRGRTAAVIESGQYRSAVAPLYLKSIEIVERSLGDQAAHTLPALMAGNGPGYDGSPWERTAPGIEPGQNRSVVAAPDLKTIGIMGGAYVRPFERIIQLMRAAKAAGPGRETVLGTPFGHSGGHRANASPASSAGLGLIYYMSSWGRPEPGSEFPEARSAIAARGLNTFGTVDKTIAGPLAIVMQLIRFAIAGVPGGATGRPAAHIFKEPQPGIIWGSEGSPGLGPAPGLMLPQGSPETVRGLNTPGIIERALARPLAILVRLFGAAKAVAPGRATVSVVRPGRPAGQRAGQAYRGPVSLTGPVFEGSPGGQPGPGLVFNQFTVMPPGREISAFFKMPVRMMLKVLQSVEKTVPPYYPMDAIKGENGGFVNVPAVAAPDYVYVKNGNLPIPERVWSGFGKRGHSGPVATAGWAAAALAVLFSRYFNIGAAGPKAVQSNIYYRTFGAGGANILRGNGPGTGQGKNTGAFSLHLHREWSFRQFRTAEYYGKAPETQGQSVIWQSGSTGRPVNRAGDNLVWLVPDRMTGIPAAVPMFFRQDKLYRPGVYDNIAGKAPETRGIFKSIEKSEKVLAKVIDRVRNKALERLIKELPGGIINTLQVRLTGTLAGQKGRARETVGRQRSGQTAGLGQLTKISGTVQERPAQYSILEKIFIKAFPGRRFQGGKGARRGPAYTYFPPENSYVVSQSNINAAVEYYTAAALRAGTDSRLTGFGAAGAPLPAVGNVSYNRSTGPEYSSPGGYWAAVSGGPSAGQTYRRPGEIYLSGDQTIRNIAVLAQRAAGQNREIADGYIMFNTLRKVNITKIFDIEKRYRMEAVFRKTPPAATGAAADAGPITGGVEYSPRSLASLPGMEYRKPPGMAGEDSAMGNSKSPGSGASAQRTVKIEDISVPVGPVPKIDINRIADRVYREIERRFKWERQRRGI